MKILMVIPTFDPVIGGAERQLQGIAPELVRRGFELTIVTRQLGGTLSAVRHPSGYVVRRLPGLGVKFGFHVRLAAFLALNARRFDVIHCHTLSGPAYICCCFGVVLRRPVLLKITRSGQGSQIDRLRRSPFRRVVRRLWSTAVVRFVAITQDTLDELLAFGIDRDRCKVIPNGVQLLPPANERDADRIEVIYTGRLIERKRVDLLLAAFAIAGVSSSCRLTIVGDGPLGAELRNQASRLPFSTSVEFTGALKHADLVLRLEKSHIFVLPSSSEGMSNSLLEAMAAGLVVLAADIDANRELINSEQNGLLFRDLDHLSMLLQEVVADPNLRARLGVAARQSIRDRFGFSSVADQYGTYYQELRRRPSADDRRSPASQP
jgi:glycosyltransferase involved in cell wall biosynthesis